MLIKVIGETAAQIYDYADYSENLLYLDCPKDDLFNYGFTTVIHNQITEQTSYNPNIEINHNAKNFYLYQTTGNQRFLQKIDKSKLYIPCKIINGVPKRVIYKKQSKKVILAFTDKKSIPQTYTDYLIVQGDRESFYLVNYEAFV